MKIKQIVPIGSISQKIFIVRGVKIMLDIDLAGLYEVPTKRLNEQVRRNKDRFPIDFMFQLNERERDEVVANCDHLAKLRFSHVLPYAFTEHGVSMLSSVLKSPRAIEINVYIIRAFIKLRELLASDKELANKVEAIEREQGTQNKHIKAIYRVLGKMIAEPVKPKEALGFRKA